MTGIRSVSKAIAAGVLGSLLWVGSASAQLITVRVQEDAGAVQLFTNGGAGPVVFNTTTPSFSVVAGAANGTATGPAAGSLRSTAINVTSAGTANPLFITVTQQGNITPGGFPAIQFTSGLTANMEPGEQTATLSTLYDPANGLFTGATLASAIFAAGGFVSDVDVVANPGGAFSVTNRYVINAPTASEALYTVELTALAVPGPVAGAALPALLGMVGFWFVRRRKNFAA
jgi:hypothetical protein